MYYAALVPCVISSLIANAIAVQFGVIPHVYVIRTLPAFSVPNAAIISVLSILCAFVSIVFCMMLHDGSFFYISYDLYQ